MTEARGGATVVTIIITMWRDIGFNRQHWSAHSLLPPVLTAAQLQVNKKNIQINVAKLMKFLLLILPLFSYFIFTNFSNLFVFRKKWVLCLGAVYFEGNISPAKHCAQVLSSARVKCSHANCGRS